MRLMRISDSSIEISLRSLHLLLQGCDHRLLGFQIAFGLYAVLVGSHTLSRQLDRAPAVAFRALQRSLGLHQLCASRFQSRLRVYNIA